MASNLRALAVSRPSDYKASAPSEPLTAADVLTSQEVATLMHVPTSTIQDWARRGVIPSRKVGRRRLYVRQRIESLLLDDSQ